MAIIGAGISGLTLGWSLKRRFGDSIDLRIYEKSGRIGGWIESREEDGFFFERGPRTLRVGETLQLIKDVGLEGDLIWSSKAARSRYVLHEGSLCPVGLTSPLLRGLKWPLLRGLFTKGGASEDLSIGDFSSRYFSKEVTERLVAPLCLGIFANHPDQLSLRCCFPTLFEALQQKKRLISFLFKGRSAPLFTLKRGLETLTTRLAEGLNISLNCPVTKITKEANGYLLSTKLGEERVDELYSAVPSWQLMPLVGDDLSIPHQSVTVVNMGWRRGIKKVQGFGFLVPPHLGDKLLGVVFDSDIFPEQNLGEETRMTAIFSGNGVENLDSVYRYLKLEDEADYIKKKSFNQAIASYPVGFDPEKVVSRYPFHCLGASFFGVGLSDVIRKARSFNAKASC